MTELVTSERGWVRTQCDPALWIPCPRQFPPGIDRVAWATGMAQAWLERSGLPHGPRAAGSLAAMLSLIHRDGYASVPCHQIWIYLRQFTVPPLPVHIGIWQAAGDLAGRLRALSGADDEGQERPALVTEFSTDSLGAGIRAICYRKLADNRLRGALGYAFRSAPCATDVQIRTGVTDLRYLHQVIGDIDALVSGMAVYPSP